MQVPPSFRFAANPRTTQDAGAWKTIYETSGQRTFQSGQQMQFLFPADGFLDPSSVSLEATVELTDADGSTVAASTSNARLTAPGAWTAIRQIDVLAGSDEMSKTRNYGLWHTIVYQYGMDDPAYDEQTYTANGQAYPKYAVYTDTDRNEIPGTRSGEQVTIRPLIGEMVQDQYLPLPFLKNVGFVLRFTLEEAARCLVTDSANPTVTNYKFSDVRLRYRVTYPNTELYAVAQAAWAAGTYTVDYNSYDWFTYTQATTGEGTDVVPITDQAASIQSAFTVVRPTQALTQQYDPLRNRRFIAVPLSDTANKEGSFQYEINGTLFPERAIQFSATNTGELYLACADAYRSLRGVPSQKKSTFNDVQAASRTYSPTTMQTDYRNGKVPACVLAMRFDAFTAAESNVILSGPDTKSAAGRLVMTLVKGSLVNWKKQNATTIATAGSSDQYTGDYNGGSDYNLTYDTFVVSKRRAVFSAANGLDVMM